MPGETEKEQEAIANDLENFFTKLVSQHKASGLDLDNMFREERTRSLPSIGEDKEKRKARKRVWDAEQEILKDRWNDGLNSFLILANQATKAFRSGSPEKLMAMLDLAKKVADLNSRFEEAQGKDDSEATDEITTELQGIDDIYGWLLPEDIARWRQKLEECGIIRKS